MLDVSKLSVRFGEIKALDNVSFAVGPDKILAITGPSGAGKTTIFQLLSGLISPDSGQISLGNEDMTFLESKHRNVAYMFESYALYPHLTVFENIASPLKSPLYQNKYQNIKIDEAVKNVLSLTEMSGFEDRYPSELSGGQKQRVALCRLLIQKPKLFLLDEPISHLDAKLRHKMRGEIRRRQIKTGVPTIWCTPDALEALSVGDTVLVIDQGTVQQIGTPSEIFLNPINTTVAKLVGDPPMNIVEGYFKRSGSSTAFFSGSKILNLNLDQKNNLKEMNLELGKKYLLGLRPTELAVCSVGSEKKAVVGETYTIETFGKYSIVTVTLGEEFVKIKVTGNSPIKLGQDVGITISATKLTLFDRDTGSVLKH